MKINKTALAAATSIAAVLVAGTAALAANFGILGAGDDAGEIAAPSVVSTTSSAPTTSTPSESPTTMAMASTPSTQVETLAYQVEGIGVVTLARSDTSLDLVSVDADSQWSWIREPAGSGVALRFTSGSTVIAFSAFVDRGQVVVDVVDQTPVPAAPSNSSVSDDDDHDDDDHEERADDHDDDDDHEERDDD